MMSQEPRLLSGRVFEKEPRRDCIKKAKAEECQLSLFSIIFRICLIRNFYIMQLHKLIHSGDLKYFPDIFGRIVEVNFNPKVPD